MNTYSFHGRTDQGGASLVVVMILLVVMTLLGLAVLRSTLLEERMSANLLDRSYAFQAAEAALRQGEAVAGAPTTRANVPANGCTNGICSLPVATNADRWLDTAFAAANWRAATAESRSEIAPPASFIVEYMGDAPTWPGCDLVDETSRSPLCLRPRYRITARSLDVAGGQRAAVILQTNFIAL
jgi:type IV pilus assembly protein PilX